MEISAVDGAAPGPSRTGGEGAQRTAADEATAASVGQSFCLGWNICRLYLSGTAPARRRWNEAPKRLPSPSRLSEAERSLVRLGQVTAAIDHLDGRLKSAEGNGYLRSAVGDQIAELNPGAEGEPDCANPRASLCEAHVTLSRALSCGDARLAKAYHLGISLATTCYAPDGPKSLKREFDRHRIAQLGEWLADLTSLFPDHASRAVRLSCGTWRRWVWDPQVSVAEVGSAGEDDPGALEWATARATRRTRTIDWTQEWREVHRSLGRQAEVWRALLSGEKPGTAMLELHDYVSAGARALRNGMRLLAGLRLALLVAFLLLLAGMTLLVVSDGAGAKVAGLVTVAGAIGVTWKGIFGGMGTIVAKLHRPVWGAALDEEIASAITTLPAGAKPVPEEAREAAPASGPQPSFLALPKEVADKSEWAA